MSPRFALNERSLESETSSTDDSELLLGLFASIKGVQDCLSFPHRNFECVTPADLGNRPLPAKTAFSAALSRLLADPDNDLARLGLVTLTKGPFFEQVDSSPLQVFGEPSVGAGYAHKANGLIFSLSVDPWKRDEVDGLLTDEQQWVVVPNIWCPTIRSAQRVRLQSFASVLPNYQDPGTHDPGSANYIVGKSHIPFGAPVLLRRALCRPDDPYTWWAYCHHRFFHRFSGSEVAGAMQVHWNGTTDPRAVDVTAIERVPKEIRVQLTALGPELGCGCR
jgi:hypothetical protein